MFALIRNARHKATSSYVSETFFSSSFLGVRIRWYIYFTLLHAVDCSLLKSILLRRFELHSISEDMTKTVLSVIESVELCICQWQQPLAELT